MRSSWTPFYGTTRTRDCIVLMSATLATIFAVFSRRRQLEASLCRSQKLNDMQTASKIQEGAAEVSMKTQQQEHTAGDSIEEEEEKPWADQGEGEAQRLNEALRAVELVRRFLSDKECGEQFVAFPALVDKQLRVISDDLKEAIELSGNFGWRLGRDVPMEKLFRENPIMKLGGPEDFVQSLVPLSMARDVGSRGKEVTVASQQRVNGERVTVETTLNVSGMVLTGAYAVAAYLLSGTSACDSRYRESSCGVLDDFHRDKLIKSLTFLFYPVWDDGLKCWGDEDDNLVLGTFTQTGERYIGNYKASLSKEATAGFFPRPMTANTNGGS
eukprot:gnl/MRDRNA2_/MRDRNA2_94449_c0_seq1.p1 gnl/MRDRNA2_/MRDRNA2_94449_c0~~gnl/MRDRNA2_/MRDRNA2_94449_c0_seq1.p1  ORF type:complete len:328 (-),score=64.80 gnl/MRDRNA2_/MRDRNA2_94449_c0_seq1:99-1082(-)